MALINNPNSWNGGTAVFNANPITETYLKLAAHREAKNQAFDQYHQKQLEGIDREGVRDIDAPDFEKKVQQWNQHWQMNKDRLRKGDIRSQIENDKLYGDIRSFIKMSKEREDAKKDALTVGTTLKKENGTLPDDFLKDLEYNDRPINDSEINPSDNQPLSRRFNPIKYLGETAPWDITKGMKKYEHLPTNKITTYGETDPNTGMRLGTTTKQFGNESKQAIAAIAGSDYQNDPSFTKAVKTAVADPATKAHLEQVYQEQMGKTPEHPEEYATALILAQKSLSEIEQKPELDKEWEARKRQQERVALQNMREKAQFGLQAMRAKNAKELADYRKKLKDSSKEEQGNVLDNTFNSIEEEAKKNGKFFHTRNGQKVGEFYKAKVPDIIKGELGRKNAEGKLEYPHEIAFNPDGTVQILYYKTNPDTGEVIEGATGNRAIDNTKTHTITKDQFKALIGKKLFGVKTTSGADYGDDDFEEDEDGEEEVAPTIFVPQKSSKKKIPGF